MSVNDPQSLAFSGAPTWMTMQNVLRVEFMLVLIAIAYGISQLRAARRAADGGAMSWRPYGPRVVATLLTLPLLFLIMCIGLSVNSGIDVPAVLLGR